MENLEVNHLNKNVAVARLRGRLDVAVAGDIEEQLIEDIDKEGYKYLVLNMDDVEYMSSSGFRVAIALLRKLKESDGSLSICNLKPAVKRIFDVIELTTLFDIYDSEKEAIAVFEAL